MNELLLFAAQNTLVALVLALFVSGLTRVWRNPPVAHWLWLLVLLKLVAPPVVPVEWARLPGLVQARGEKIASVPRIEAPNVAGHVRFVTRPLAGAAMWESVTPRRDHDLASIGQLWKRARPHLLAIWFGGAAVCGLVAAMRIARFDRLVRDTLPASQRLRRLTMETAGKLGVHRVPDVRYAECVVVPMLWWAGRRPTIVLPMRLSSELDDERLVLILAHELAHLRRHDPCVRAIELLVSTIYWWNPLVWLIRRQIHQAEELCCDAWVRWAFPDCTRRYAEVLLKAAQSLGTRPLGARFLPVSPFLRSLSLKARIEMILESRFVPCISKRSTFVIALLALLVLPSFVPLSYTQAAVEGSDEAPTTEDRKAAAPATSEFPHAVHFEQGATRFLQGDTITVLEVRGTAETFMPGNIYWIRGKYKLASHDRAMLAAYTTAMDAANGTGGYLKVQTAVVNQGDGTFTLFLPMSCRGWPHVSFYPADGGSDFGGNYFGTGDSVLKRWWGSKETD